MNISQQSEFVSTLPLMVGLISAFVLIQLAVDFYLPALPILTHAWQVSNALIKATMSVYFLGLGISQLFYAVWMERFGAKRIMLLGQMIFAVSAWGCMHAHDIWSMLVYRLIGGCAAGSVPSGSRMIIAKSLSPKQIMKANNCLSIAWACTPIIAPTLGAHIMQAYGWRAIFLSIMCLSLCVGVLLYRCIEEEHMPQSSSSWFSGFMPLLADRSFIQLSILAGCAYGGLLTFIVASPFIMQNQLHLSIYQYGHHMLFIALGYLVGSTMNHDLILRYDLSALIKCCGFSVSCCLIFWSFCWYHATLPMLMSAGFILHMVSAMLWPNACSAALVVANRLPSYAAGLFGFITQLIFAVVTALSARSPGYCVAVSIAIAWVVVLFSWWQHKRLCYVS